MSRALDSIRKKKLSGRPTVDVPEWATKDNAEGRFYVAKLSTKVALEVLATQRRLCPELPEDADDAAAEAAFAAALMKNGGELSRFYVLIVSKAIQTAAGERLFDSPEGRELLEDEDPAVLSRVAREVQEKLGYTPAEDPSKNSQGTPASSSS